MKTTKKEFERFQKAFLYYVNLFGLKRYKVWFKIAKLDGSYATVTRCEKSKAMVVEFASHIDAFSRKGWQPELTALHEAIHALLGELVHIGSCRWAHPSEIEDAEEGLVRVLEKVIPLPP